ncbi:MAG: hypothetical protein IJZ29_03785 [Clostridia bacterium]|nr:hypothetical protein [Clostridia bacterium]
MKLGKNKKSKIEFDFFNEQYSKEYFKSIYGISLSVANNIILNNCLTLSGLEECKNINNELNIFAIKKFCDENSIFVIDSKLLEEGYLEKRFEENFYFKKQWQRKRYESVKTDLLNLRKNQAKRQEFLNLCEKSIDENKNLENVKNVLYAGGLIGTPLVACAIFIWKTLEKNNEAKAIYKEIYPEQSENLKNEYVSDFGFSSSDEFESYLNTFIVDLTKDEALQNLSTEFSFKKEELANYFGASSFEELTKLIEENTATLSKKEYISLLKDKYNLNISNLARDNGFDSVSEMNAYINYNVIEHPAQRVMVGYLVFRNIPAYNEYKTELARTVYLQKKEYTKEYNITVNNLPFKEKEYIEVNNANLSIAKDELKSLEKEYNIKLEEIMQDDSYPKQVYSEEYVENLADSYDVFCDSISGKVMTIAKQGADVDISPLDFGVPAGIASCTFLGGKMIQTYVVGKRRNKLIKNLEILKESEVNLEK